MKSNFFKKAVSLTTGAVMMFSASIPQLSVMNASAESSSKSNYDLAKLLQYSMYFYDANMCGDQVSENTQLKWRGDCHTSDAKIPLQPMDDAENGTNLSQAFIDKYKDILDPDGDGCVDVAGGLHDAGDHVEFGMPENYTAATLGWGYYEFRDSYVKTGQDKHIETLLRYVNDYLMKCTFLDENDNMIAFCYQVGDGDIDHAYWQSPETDSMIRPAYFLTADKPQTDYVASACAALAINYLNFKDTDKEYAEKSLKYAKALWNFAETNDKELSDNADGPKQYYMSNKWEDDYCWAAAWMYICTEDKHYLETSAELVDYYAPSGWCYCWNDMWSGANTMWAIINQQHPELDLVNMVRKAQGKNQYVYDDFWDEVEKAFTAWKGLETAGGYAFRSQWGSARYNTAMQLISLVYDKYTNNGKPGAQSEWAMGQMNYLLGDNPLKRCYVVGYADNSCKYPHHRAASGLLSAEDTREQRHVLYGALVGGPDGSDNHIDVTSDYIYNEVTIDYNAAFVGAAAGLYAFFGTDDMAVTPDFPPEESSSGEEGGGNNYWVEAVGVDDMQATTSAGTTKVSLKVMTDSISPKTDISIRYYFDSSEISNVNSVEGKELYDQAATEDGDKGANGVLSGPFKYDKKDNTYYFEVKWDGYKIANSGKKYQFLMGMYYGDTWNPKNDWSYDGLKIGTDNDFFANGSEEKTDKICVYSDGVLVGGTEPDGSTPSVEEPSTEPETKATTATTTVTTATTKTTTITTVTDKETEDTTETETETDKTSETVDTSILYGDVNSDGEVTIADAVLLNKYLVKSAALNEPQLKAADCLFNDKVDSNDTLAILKLIVGTYTELPVYPE